MKTKKSIKVLAFICMITLLLGSINVSAATFGLNQKKVTINIGESFDLDVTGTDQTPRWTTWGINTVKVNQDGIVTGVRKGKTTVSARIGLSKQKCVVTVVDPTIKLNKKAATIYTGGTSTSSVQLKATNKGSSKNVVWSSSNPEVAIVDTKGKVTSVSEGTATITATGNNEITTCEITVKNSSISLDHDQLTLSTKGAGSSIKLKPTIIGSNKAVKWTSSDNKIATVKNGIVTGKNTGTAIITAKANGISTTCNVTVSKGSISINEEQTLLYVGENKIVKTNAGKKDVVTWTSSNTSIATVDDKGKITAIGAGNAIISAELNGTKDTCNVTVKETTTNIGESKIELRTKGTDSSYVLNYQVIGRKPNIKWTVSDKKIATVNANGKVVAKKAGETVITMTANGVSDTVNVVVKDYDPTIKLNQNEYVLYTKKGNVLNLKATVNGISKKVTWTSSNPNVAIVNAKGKVTAQNAGEAVISATANGVTSECVVTVTESKVLLEKNRIFLEKGDKAELPVDVVGASQKVTYKTTNKKIATIKNGIITAKNYGDVDIKVTANGITEICHVSVDECVHEFNEGVVRIEPTCFIKGEKEFTCTKCPYTYIEYLDCTDHKWVESTRHEANCVNLGTVIYQCANCQASKHEILNPTGHTYGEWLVCSLPTEISRGIEKRYCTVCNAEDTRYTEFHEHEYTSVITEATCTEGGYTTYTCACGESYVDNQTDALGHEWSEWTVSGNNLEERSCSRCPATETREITAPEHKHEYTSVVTEPTCLNEGYTTYTCECGYSYTDSKVDALGHDWSDWVVIEPTIESEGSKTRACSRCPETETETIPKLDHTHVYESVITAPTCEENGYTTYTCECNHSYVDDYVDALGHKFGEWFTNLEPTEDTVGQQTRECERCFETQTQELPKLNHTHQYTTEVVDPTCLNAGYTVYTCACEDTYKSDYIDALGHDWSEWTETIEATEETEGQKERSCTRCSETQTQTIPKKDHEHDYQSVVTEPTCLDEGYTTYTCNSCGASHTDDYTSALGHEFNDWYTLDKATEMSNGLEARVCGRCELMEKRETPKLDHVHNYTDTITNPTCTEAGYTTHTCICGESYKDTYVDATGHDYGDYVTTQKATCLEEGFKERTCSKCSHVDIAVINMRECQYSKRVTIKAATCTEEGLYDMECIYGCGLSESYTTPALGHKFATEYTIDKAATCIEEGSKSQHCSRCDEKQNVTSIPTTDHTYGTPTYTWSSDKTTCTAKRTCTICENVETETVNSTNAVTKQPSCTMTGVKTYTATFVNSAFSTQTKKETVQSLGHRFTMVIGIDVQPTCTEVGRKVRKCSRSGCTQQRVETPAALGHDFGDNGTGSGHTVGMCTYECGAANMLHLQNNWDYTISNNGTGDEIHLIHYKGTNQKVIIPNVIVDGKIERKVLISSNEANLDDGSYMFNKNKTITSVYFYPGITAVDSAYFNHMFRNCSNLQSIDFNGFTAPNCISMARMFSSCPKLTELDLSSFDLSTVQYANYMFYGTTNLTAVYADSIIPTTATTTNMWQNSGCRGFTRPWNGGGGIIQY